MTATKTADETGITARNVGGEEQEWGWFGLEFVAFTKTGSRGTADFAGAFDRLKHWQRAR